MKNYFSYDENEGFVLHETAEAAKKAAQSELDIHRDEAIKEGEWYDEVQTICWGELAETINKVIDTGVAWDYQLSKPVK